MAKLHLGNKSQASLLKRLAVVFADPLRLKIVTELYMREMSPKQFFEEFGGGSISRVDRHFKALVEHGWLRLVREETGGRRRGGVEHFYRAAELAVFDLDTWSRLPYSIKVAFSWRTFEQLAERVRAAIAADTFDARPDRHLSWTPVHLDRLGWERVIAALDALFESLFEAQADAKLRIARSGEEPILATVALAGFESPPRLQGSDEKRGRAASPLVVDPAKSLDSPMPLPVRLAKVFADELGLKVVTELNLREMSPKQFFEEFGGGSLSAVSRRFNKLVKCGWLTLVRTETGGRRRGAVEHFYRATELAVFDSQSWSNVPASTKATFSWRTFEQFAEQLVEAIEARMIDSRSDRHFTWSLLLLDQLGWEQVIAAVEALFALIFEEQESAKLRLAETGEEPIRMTVGLAAFESPKDSTKAP